MTDDDFVPQALRVGENLFTRIDDHLRTIKFLKKEKIKKKEWIASAVEEKLKKERNLNLKNIPKEKNLSYRLNPKTVQELDARVEMIKQFRRSFSRKQWVMEAILEKLEQEENLSKEFENLILYNSKES